MNGLARNAPILFWIGAIASLRRRVSYAAYSRLPKGSHDGIVAADDEPIAIGLVDEQAGESEQGLILGVEQEPERMTEDVFEARPPALRPDVFERRDDVGGGGRALGLGNTREGIVGEGVGRVGRVEVDHVLAALLRREARDMLARIAVGIEKAEARAGQEVGVHHVEEQSGLAGAGHADEVDVPAAIGLQQRHVLAGDERAENCFVVRGHGWAAVPCRVFARLVQASVGQGGPPLRACRARTERRSCYCSVVVSGGWGNCLGSGTEPWEPSAPVRRGARLSARPNRFSRATSDRRSAWLADVR